MDLRALCLIFSIEHPREVPEEFIKIMNRLIEHCNQLAASTENCKSNNCKDEEMKEEEKEEISQEIIKDKSESSPTTSAEYQPSKKPRLSADSEEPSPSISPKEENKKEELCDSSLLMPTSPAHLAEVIRKSATTLVSLLQGGSKS